LRKVMRDDAARHAEFAGEAATVRAGRSDDGLVEPPPVGDAKHESP
jgi:hypothetical protein